MNIGDAVSMLTAGILESSAPRVIPAAKETSGNTFRSVVSRCKNASHLSSRRFGLIIGDHEDDPPVQQCESAEPDES